MVLAIPMAEDVNRDHFRSRAKRRIQRAIIMQPQVPPKPMDNPSHHPRAKAWRPVFLNRGLTQINADFPRLLRRSRFDNPKSLEPAGAPGRDFSNLWKSALICGLNPTREFLGGLPGLSSP
jgi:hypothetical protein